MHNEDVFETYLNLADLYMSNTSEVLCSQNVSLNLNSHALSI